MNKKILASCFALSICLTAVAPVYNHLSLANKSVHPLTEWNEPSSGRVSATQQQLSFADYTVTYPEEIQKVEALSADLDLDAIASMNNAKNTAIKPTNMQVTNAVNSATTNRATVTKTAPTSTKTVSRSGTSSSTRTRTRTSTRSTTTRNTLSSRGETASVETSSRATAVINTAKSYIGVPYVWGGTTPDGFDCSGYIQYVLSRNGISVPRTAADQFNSGIAVSKSNLRAGDLVFFTTYKAGPSHVGFYLGDGRFIHASSSKGVAISSLSNTYYSSRYIGARRVF